jgi:hypothetical protein
MLLPRGLAPLFGTIQPWWLLAAAALLGATAWLRGAALRVWELAALAVAAAFCLVCAQAFPAVLAGGQRSLVGLFGATPLLLLGVMAIGRAPRSIAGAAGLAGALFVALAFATSVDKEAGGLQIGGRHLMAAGPLLVLGATTFWDRSLVRRLTALALVAATLVAVYAQLVSLARLKKFHGNIAEKAFASGTRDIVTSFWWVGQILFEGYSDHRIYLRPNKELVDDLRRAGVREIVQVQGGFSADDLRAMGMRVVDGGGAPAAVRIALE